MGKSDLRVFIGADASNFNKNIKAAQGQLVKFENVAKSVGSSIKTALVSAFAIDSAQRFFSTMIEAGRGFENQMARVKAISNASTKNFEMMRKEAARLGDTTRYSAKEAAAALENLVRNGLSATKATKALASVLELAGANAIELAEAADIVTNTMNMFSLSVEELGRVNDVLSKTTASSATNLTDLYEALKYAAPTANLFGINIEEVNAALGVLANQGIKGSQAGTTLRNVLNSLIKPSAQAADILANLGIDEVSIKLDGLLGTLDKLKGLQISDFVKIFGKEFGGITASLVNNSNLTTALKGSLDESMGEAARMFKEGAGGFNTAIDNFSSAFEGAMIKMFDSVKPMLTSFINGMTDFINVISDGGSLMTIVGTTSAGMFAKGLKKTYDETKKTNTAITEYEDLLIRIGQVLSDETKWKNPIWEDNQFTGDYRGITQHLIEIDIAAKNLGREIPSLKKALDSLDSIQLKDFHDALQAANDSLVSLGKEGINVKNVLQTYSEQEFDILYGSLAAVRNELRHQYFELKKVGGAEADVKKLEKAYRNLNQALEKMKYSTGNFANMQAYQEVLKALQVDIANVEKKTSALGNVFGKIGGKIKGLFTAIGGWWTVGITAAVTAATALYNGWKKIDQAVREVKDSIKKTKSDNDKLNTSFKTTVNELAKLEKGSIAWNTRLAYLKQNYPELTEQLRLNEVYVNSSSEAYKNLADSMQRVIDKQSKINLADAAVAARDKLNETYANNDFGWMQSTALNNIKKGLEHQYDSEADKIMIQAYIQEYMSILASTVEDEVKKSKLSEVFNRMSKEFSRAKFSDNLPQILLNDYNKRVGNEIKGLGKYLNHETHQGITTDDVNRYVYEALTRLNEYKASSRKDAEAKFTDEKGVLDKAKVEEYVANETKSFASQLLDDILNKFRGIQIEGKDVRDLLKIDANFNEIANAARTKTSSGNEGGDSNVPEKTERELANEAILEAEDEYAKVTQMLADLCEKDLIKTEEFDQRYLAALGQLISVYERWWHILDEDQAKAHEEWVRYYNELKTASPVDDGSLSKQIAQDKGNYKNSLNEILGRKSGIDIFSDNMQFQEGRLEHLKGQLEDLKALREEYLGKGFDNEIKSLDGAIITLTQHVEELDKAFTAERLKEFKKELTDLTWNVGTASYDTFVGLGQAFINVGDAMKTLSNLDEYKTEWERFVAGFQAFISITDTMLNTALGIKELAEMFKELRKQKELFNAIDSGSKVADIAGIEMEAAAVVQAEATKTAAKETAAAADIATKMLQAEAAQILMAAESTAAYAAIPFAGPALAAAQIAEMKALILAAASLPAFANGGIVGGNSYIGDKVLARVNSGEMILNQKQQKNLFGMINNGSSAGAGEVKFEIEGKKLVGVLKNYNNIKGKVQ